jgi:hypothetical protein
VDTGPEQELPMVTGRLLRGGNDRCDRRAAAAFNGRRDTHRNWASDAGYEVANRVEQDARAAHAEMRAPRAGDFPIARDLLPEQQRVHAAAGIGYFTLFGDRAACTATDVEPMANDVDDIGVRLVGGYGIALDLDDGSREIRVLRLGHRDDRPLIEATDIRLALLRAGDWARAARDELRIVAADLLTLERIDIAVRDDDIENARRWLRAGVERLESLTGDVPARAGDDCRGCPVIAQCPIHVKRP